MKISRKRILKQFKDDLIGKDSHRGITLTYAWLANQFGHISLGYIPAFILYHFLCLHQIRAAIYVSVAWLLFEIYNFLGPLLSKKESSSGVLFIPKKTNYQFKPKWKNVAYDTFTDVCFFALGAFLFSFTICAYNTPTIIVLIVLSIYLIFASKYWFVTKMYQFYARFPFQFRLSQWDFSITKKHKEKVDKFLKTKPSEGNHVLISGSLSKGKTSLGVGILNELSIKHQSCLYVSAIKMCNYFFKDEDDVLEAHEIWDWKSANFLMIDDINPSEPIQNNLLTPDVLLSFVDANYTTKKNRELLKNKNVIWVLGSVLTEEESKKWVNMLFEIGVSESKISLINL